MEGWGRGWGGGGGGGCHENVSCLGWFRSELNDRMKIICSSLWGVIDSFISNYVCVFIL